VTRRLLLAVLLAGVTLTGCSSGAGSDAGAGFVAGNGTITSIPAADRKAPGPVSGDTLDGKHVSLGDYLGKVVVVNVWGSWCGPCRAEAPMLAQAARDYQGQDVVFLGIDSRDTSTENALAFVRGFDIPYPSIYDPTGQALLAFRGTVAPNAVPSTVIIDAQGRVSGSVLGSATRGTIDGLVSDAKDL
jgi:thiol-disulfide isomerase/thioredoxin